MYRGDLPLAPANASWSARAPQRPVDLGSYRLIRCIGQGAMADVYEAVQRKLERTVAIKILRPKLAADPHLVNRFFHEARAANIIRSPHVIEVHDFVEAGRDVYFVMEFLRGHNLRHAICAEAPMTLDRAGAILLQMAAGLHDTHAHQIVHRDIKPENIFLSARDGGRDFVKLIDFGIAKLHRPDGRLTVEGDVLGTPEYMSPEQAGGYPVDARSDIYSLACVGYEMLTRQPLFRGDAPVDVLTMQMNQPPTPIRQQRANLPEALDELIMRALSKSPDDRPPTAVAFAEALTRALGPTASDKARFTAAPAPRSQLLRPRVHRAATWRTAVAVGLAAIGVVTATVLATARRPTPVVTAPHPATVPAPREPRAASGDSATPSARPVAAAPAKPIRPEPPRARRRLRPSTVTDLHAPETTIDPFAK